MATILVVDDEPTILKLCARILTFGHHEVLEAPDAGPVLQLLDKTPVDLALLDVVMPGMNGIELAGLIEQRHPHTKIVLMSGYGPREILKITGKENPYRIIWKPFKSESLLRMIDTVLADPESNNAKA